MGVEEQAPSSGEAADAAVSEAQIAVHWREEEYYPPPEAFVAQANASDPAIPVSYTHLTLPTICSV